MRAKVWLVGLALVATACGDDGAAPSTTVPATAVTSTTTVAVAASSTTTAAPSSVVADFVASLGFGDCVLIEYDSTGEDFNYAVPPEHVDCDEPHDLQVFFAGELSGAEGEPWPGDDAIGTMVFDDACDSSFRDTFGVGYDDALSLIVWGIWALEEEWDTGFRSFACAVASPANASGEGQLVGQADSAGRTLPGHLLATVGQFDTRDVFIWIFGEEGEILDVVNLTADGDEAVEGSTVSWSPDLSTIAYSAELPDGNSEILLVDVNTGAKTNISNDPAGDFSAAFSPDGSRIVFGSDRVGGVSNLFVMDVDGANVSQLTVHDERDSSADWSPDGTRIVFRRRTAGNDDIWTVDSDGSNPRFLVGGPDGEYDPAWSPDGSTIAFISNEGGDFDIWTFPADGITTIGAPPSLAAALATRVTDEPGNDEYPSWTPDGNSIVFQSDRHGVTNLWVMRTDGTEQSTVVFDYPLVWPQAARP